VETVTVLRATTTEDAYGDPKPGPFADHHTLNANCAPANSSEPLIAGQNKVITGFVVYVRDVVADVLPTDRVRIRGVVYDIDGTAGEWFNRESGDLIGTQFATKAAV
jgi:head-tail adaptor